MTAELDVSGLYTRLPRQQATMYVILWTADEPLTAHEVYDSSAMFGSVASVRTQLTTLVRTRDDVTRSRDRSRPYTPYVYTVDRDDATDPGGDPS